MKEIPADYVKFSGGLLRIEFSIPEEQLEKGKAVIRLEAGAEESRASFTLHGFRIYGTAMENPPVRTQEKLRTQDTVAAETATVSAEKPEEKTELKVETAAGVNLLTEPVASTGTEREELEGMQQIQGIEEQSDFNLTIILAIYVCVSFSILAAGTALVIFFIRKRK